MIAAPVVKSLVPTAVSKLTSTGVKEAGKKMGVGAGIGYAYDVAVNMQGGESGFEALTPGFGTLLGAGLPALGYAFGATKELAKPKAKEKNIEGEISEDEAKQALSQVQGGNKRFQDALAALTGKPVEEAPLTVTEEIPSKGGFTSQQAGENLNSIKGKGNPRFQSALEALTRSETAPEARAMDTVNPVLADETLKASPDKPATIQNTKRLKSSPTLIKGMSAMEAMTSYDKTGDTRFLIHVVATMLNSKFLNEKDKADNRGL